jgi:hypothetical protein
MSIGYPFRNLIRQRNRKGRHQLLQNRFGGTVAVDVCVLQICLKELNIERLLKRPRRIWMNEARWSLCCEPIITKDTISSSSGTFAYKHVVKSPKKQLCLQPSRLAYTLRTVEPILAFCWYPRRCHPFCFFLDRLICRSKTRKWAWIQLRVSWFHETGMHVCQSSWFQTSTTVRYPLRWGFQKLPFWDVPTTLGFRPWSINGVPWCVTIIWPSARENLLEERNKFIIIVWPLSEYE